MEKRKEKVNLYYLCIHIKSLVSFLVQSIYVVFLLNKAEEIFLCFFCKKKKKKPFEYASNLHSFEILKHTLKYILKI